MKYIVIENTPGYLPDSEPVEFTNKHDAYSYAADLAKELSEMGYNVVGKNGEYLAQHPDREYDLGRVIETVVDYSEGSELPLSDTTMPIQVRGKKGDANGNV
jgi:hypothetical protein